jgi:hypothetical protein
MKRKNSLFFSLENSKRRQIGTRFASFHFEAHKFLKQNWRTLLQTTKWKLFEKHRHKNSEPFSVFSTTHLKPGMLYQHLEGGEPCPVVGVPRTGNWVLQTCEPETLEEKYICDWCVK